MKLYRLLILVSAIIMMVAVSHYNSSRNPVNGVRKNPERTEPQHPTTSPAAPVDSSVTNKPQKTEGAEPKVLPDKASKLSGFESLKKKVLLNRNELAEKETILSNLETVRWAESSLSAIPRSNSEAKSRLAAIDFLEEAVAWKENPNRSEVIESIEGAIKTNRLAETKRELRNMVIGDKIDLFTTLVQEEPAKARAILTGSDDPWLRDILNYAVKRLALEKRLSEVR